LLVFGACAAAPAFGCGSTVVGGVGGDQSPGPTRAVGSGSLIGVGHDANGGGVLLRLDPATGSTVTVVSLPPSAISSSGIQASAFDPDLGRYMYLTFGASGEHLVTVDVENQSVLADVPLSANVARLAIDESTNDVLTEAWSADGTTMVFYRIDPMTGALTSVPSSALPPSSSVPSSALPPSAFGPGVYDGADNYYAIHPIDDSADPPWVLDRFTVSTGQTTEIPLGHEAVMDFGYDVDLGELYALVHGEDSAQVVRIDTSSGAVTTLATIADVGNELIGARAFDRETHRYFFVAGAGPWEGNSMWTPGNAIYTVDVETGQTVGSSPVIGVPKDIFNLQFAP
jgi:hypothetical protein